MKFLLLLISIITSIGTFAQSVDTVYLDSKWKKTEKANCTYFRVLIKDNNGIYRCNDYWKSGEIQMQGQLSSLYPETREGKYVWYYKTGVIRKVINYSNGIKTGLVQSYDSSGNLDVEYCGNLDSLDNGEEVRRAINNFWYYVSRKLKYPEKSRKSEIEGTVQTEFYLNSEGQVTRLKIIKSVSEEIDKEALRVILSYDKWPIPIYKGNRTMLLCSFPLVFQLN